MSGIDSGFGINRRSSLGPSLSIKVPQRNSYGLAFQVHRLTTERGIFERVCDKGVTITDSTEWLYTTVSSGTLPVLSQTFMPKSPQNRRSSQSRLFVNISPKDRYQLNVESRQSAVFIFSKKEDLIARIESFKATVLSSDRKANGCMRASEKKRSYRRCC